MRDVPSSPQRISGTCYQLDLSNVMSPQIAQGVRPFLHLMLLPASHTSSGTTHCAQPALQGWGVRLYLLGRRASPKIFGILLCGRFFFSTYIFSYLFLSTWTHDSLFCTLSYNAILFYLVPDIAPALATRSSFSWLLCTCDISSLSSHCRHCEMFWLILCIPAPA